MVVIGLYLRSGKYHLTEPTSNGKNDTDLAIFDIAALQYLYGVNKNHKKGDDIYTFADKHIWDGAGKKLAA